LIPPKNTKGKVEILKVFKMTINLICKVRKRWHLNPKFGLVRIRVKSHQQDEILKTGKKSTHDFFNRV
jgi:hypothetical protein